MVPLSARTKFELGSGVLVSLAQCQVIAARVHFLNVGMVDQHVGGIPPSLRGFGRGIIAGVFGFWAVDAPPLPKFVRSSLQEHVHPWKSAAPRRVGFWPG